MMGHVSSARLCVMAVLLGFSACAPLAPRPVAAGPTIFQEQGREEPAAPEVVALLEAHNRERAEAGLPPVKLNDRLSAAAVVQAKDMAKHSKMSHAGSDKSTPFQRIERRGYRFRKAGENVAYGQDGVAEVMDAWMKSPPHKANILGDFTEMGAAKRFDQDGVPYWCVDFGRPWPTTTAEAAGDDVLKAINKVREEAKLPAMVASPVLTKAAARHAKFMAEKGVLDAKEDDGKTAIQRVADQGKFRTLSQGDASGAATAADLIKGWLADPNQKKSLLGEFDSIGVGHAQAADGTPYWTIMFGGGR